MTLIKRALPERRFRDTIIVVLISISLFIPAAELTLRAFCTYCTYSERIQGRFISPYSIGESSWYRVRAPNAVSSYRQQEFDYKIRTNSLGFRDIEHPVLKPQGERRILAIGDSFTEGQGAAFEQTWLNRLGSMLNAKVSGDPFRMICGGVAGSDPFFGYRILVDKLLAYQPDVVLLVVNHSDVMDVIVRGGMERFQPDGTVKGVDSPDIPWLYESSHFARFILFELFDYTHHFVTRSERDIKAQQALERLLDLVSEYKSLLDSRGIGFSLVILPFSGELKRNQYDKLDLLKEFALRHQVDVIDIKPYLFEKLMEPENRLEDIYWPIDAHFTALGYRYFAEAVEAGLRPGISRVQVRANQMGE